MPSNFNYMNQSGPFWDFLAKLEQQGPQHPIFSADMPDGHERERENADGRQGPTPSFNPWDWSNQAFGGPRGMPYRGSPHREPAPNPFDDVASEKNKEKEVGDGKDADTSDEKDNGEGPAGPSASDNEGGTRGWGRHGRCGGRRGRCASGGPGGPRGFGNHGGPPHHGPGSHRGPPHGHHIPRRSWGRGGPFGGFGGSCSGMFDPMISATQFWNQFNDSHPSNRREADEGEDFSPDADIFDTESAFVVHISLPGAKKEDVGVNWEVEKSELVVAGVIYRPGDEEFLKTLAVNERKVGPFERRIRLGTRASPAHIDADGITAKLEDGVLRIEVPKMDGGFVEIKKVDIE